MALKNRTTETTRNSRAAANYPGSSGVSYPAVQPLPPTAEHQVHAPADAAVPVIQGYFTWMTQPYRFEKYDLRFWQDACAVLGPQLGEELKAAYGEREFKRFMAGLQAAEEIDIGRDANMMSMITSINDRRKQAAKQSVTTRYTGDVPAPTHTTFSTMTHNVEKYAASTASREEKTVQEARAMDLFQPDIMTQQEVTRPDLFLQDLMSHPRVAGQYEALPGPAFKSGTYRESYPMQYNTGAIPFAPELRQMDPTTSAVGPYKGPLLFGAEAAAARNEPNLKQARPNTFWELQKPVSRLRPAYKHTGNQKKAEAYAKKHANLRHRAGMKMVRMRLMNVHTSPGTKTPTIHKQVNKILSDMEILQQGVHNTLASGDFYMEMRSKTNWEKLHSGEGEFKSLNPEVKTNYVRGIGKQIADHAVVPQSWQGTSSHAIPPLTKEDTQRSAMDRGEDESILKDWLNIGVDHTPVLSTGNIPVQDTTTNMEEYLRRVFRNDIYRQPDCLIYAVAHAAGVPVNDRIIGEIRNNHTLQRIASGGFILPVDASFSVILRALGLCGRVQIYYPDAPELPVGAVAVPARNDEKEANITINYSRYYHFAAPRS